MGTRIGRVAAGVALAAAALGLGGSPATAAPAPVVAAGHCDAVSIHFMNEGYYYAYADVWAYDANYNVVDHDWSGTLGHSGSKDLCIDPNAAHLKMLVRYDPTGETIHDQWIEDWPNYPQKWCGNGTRTTIYVGGTWHNADHYDIHCKRL